MGRKIPTVIAFFGQVPGYLKVCLRSAADFNDRVVLIGDDTNAGAWPDHWDSSRTSLPKFDEFRRSYVKMSDYTERFEMAFWRRPFAVEQWMQHERVDQIFLLDSDIVTFADYARDVLPRLPPDCRAALMAPGAQDNFVWANSLHFSFWTLDALKDFTSFCIEAYRDPEIRRKLEEKHRWHIDNAKPGGICEMTLLYLWCERNGTGIGDLSRAGNGIVGDLSVSSSSNHFGDEYEMRRRFKAFVFKDGAPYGFNRVLGQQVRFLCIHCQGDAKRLMKFLYGRWWRRFYAELYDIEGTVIRCRGRLRARSRLKNTLRSIGLRDSPE
jgi:hypothetical protein